MYIKIKFLKSDEQSLAQINELLESYGATILPIFEMDAEHFGGKLKDMAQNYFERTKDIKKITLADLNYIEALYDSLGSAALEEIVDRDQLSIELETCPEQLKEPLSPADSLEMR